MTALAAGFDVDIAFFTTNFHSRHRDESMAHRVLRARTNWAGFHRTAAHLYELPPASRATVLALLEILEARERGQ